MIFIFFINIITIYFEIYIKIAIMKYYFQSIHKIKNNIIII